MYHTPGIKFFLLKHCRYFTEILHELLLFQRAKTNIIDKFHQRSANFWSYLLIAKDQKAVATA